MTALAAARTLIHEYIHADVFRKLNTKYTSNGDLDFKKTYEKYESEKHHNAMAWQGLKEHNVKSYVNLPTSKKTELTNSLNTYYHSTTKNCPN